MPLLIRNGEIVTATERRRADIFCADETITRIEPGIAPPPGTAIVEAAGKLVFPGFIDPHVHVHLPCMGTRAKDDYVTASRAALIGGTTTFIDMCGPLPDREPVQLLEEWNAQSQGRSACDYSYHMGVREFSPRIAEQLREIVAGGITSFKVLLAYKGTIGISDAALYRTLRLGAELGVITAAHCENETAIAERQAEFIAAGRTGPEWHEPSRPPEVEADGVHHLLTFARLTGAPVYIVHLSCQEALRVALDARQRRQAVWIETLIQYLLLDRACAEQPGFEGAKYVMSPPLRDRSNHAPLWEALRSGEISVVATDHAPFAFATQKRLGEHDFTKIPNGLPGLEDRVNLLWTYGVRTGRIDVHRFVDVASTQPARLFGLYPRKGEIRPGSDADLVVFDPEYRGRLSASTQTSNVDYNPYEGMQIAGRPHVVTVRGEIVVREGKYIGTPGRGRLLRRDRLAT